MNALKTAYLLSINISDTEIWEVATQCLGLWATDQSIHRLNPSSTVNDFR